MKIKFKRLNYQPPTYDNLHGRQMTMLIVLAGFVTALLLIIMLNH